MGADSAEADGIDYATGFCMVKTVYTDATLATEASSGTPVYACAPAAVTELVVCKNDTTNTAMECYCDTAMCNDITKCDCHTGDNYTPYANTAKNTDWANAENGAPPRGHRHRLRHRPQRRRRLLA